MLTHRRLTAGSTAAVVVMGLAVAAWTPRAAEAAPAVAPARSDAPGAPGALSYQAQARKDCVGTARNTRSKIWYTVANGVLSDVYAPTADATNVQTMQYLVTDGSTFTDLQTRDMTYTATSDATGMVCRVTATAKSGQYRLTSLYLTDPARASVIVRTTYRPLTAAAAAFHLYVRLDANAGGNGGGSADNGTVDNGGADSAVVDTSTGSPVPVSYDTSTTSQAATRDYAVPSFLALRATSGFTAVSSGFVGTASDGLTQLDTGHALSPAYPSATAGNVEQTAGVRLDAAGSVTLALGFGTTQAAAVGTAGHSVSADFTHTRATYKKAWHAYDSRLRTPSPAAGLSAAERRTAVTDYYQSANVVKASEDKTFPGAMVAGLDAPWGQSISAGNPDNLFATGYREVFARDAYEAWTAFYTDGDLASARAVTRFLLLKSQLPDGSEPRNSLLNGTKAPDAFNIQLDEAAYPVLMAWQSGLSGERALWPHVKAAADFLISHGPSFGAERWEEQTGYSPSTISAEIAGLVAAAAIARGNHHGALARTWLATADHYQRSVKAWGVTTTGPLSPSPYFIRLSKTGDPDAAISYSLGNGGATVDQRSVVDLGFLEYVRLGELPATDATVRNSVHVADANLKKQTANGPGWLRYNGDGYGDCNVAAGGSTCTVTGAPWTLNNVGTGHPWPVLGAERAQQYLARGHGAAAASVLAAINRMNSGPGLVPEQVWDGPDLPASPYGTDPTTASIGFTNGEADGSASPLTWGSASQVRLTADLSAGRSLEQPSVVRSRYVSHTQPGTTLTVTAPADLSALGTSATVRGTAAPRAVIDVADVATDANNATTHATTTARANGSFALRLPIAAGSNALIISSTAPGGGTAQTVRTVVNDTVDGTLLFDQSDPTGDDDGPGNYAYPTAGDFHPGAFDLTDFQVYDTGATVTFRVQTRDLTPTFGSTAGAQLVDVYVHDPAATATSTAASYPSMNYSIDAAAAWSRLIEAQGFTNQRFVDATGASLGTVTTTANSISRYITFSVDKAALGGTPTSGWGFTVTLTGQDGTGGAGSPQTREFTATPGGYTFGVCAATDSSPLCTADPGSVPKVVDVLTPVGTTQSDELDYTLHPSVTLHDVTLG